MVLPPQGVTAFEFQSDRSLSRLAARGSPQESIVQHCLVGAQPRPATFECVAVHIVRCCKRRHVYGDRVRPLLEQQRQILIPQFAALLITNAYRRSSLHNGSTTFCPYI